MGTAQQSLITVTVDGRDLGVFDMRSGGNVTSSPAKRRGGGMGPQRTSASLPEYGDLTVAREFDPSVDAARLARYRQVGAGRARMTVTEKPLAADGSLRPEKPQVWSGRLKDVELDDSDSESGDPQLWRLIMSVEEVA